MKTACFALAAVAIAGMAAVSGQQGAKEASHPVGYLTRYLKESGIPDMVRVLPTAPPAGTPRDNADRVIFKTTRALQDSPRWKLAQSDNDMSVTGMLAAFRCAIGMTVTRGNAPHFAALLDRVSEDANVLTGPPKAHYHRDRPFLKDAGPVCVMRPDTPDFPSGHSTFGWATGLILAEIMPDRASEVLTRGRSFGESRVVCGVHTASAVEGGRVVGAALVATLNSIGEFRGDLEAVKAELAGLRRNPPAPPANCAAEAALIANTPY
jgi:acid phosphatase (class A)